jgi:hypothetical protein
MFVMNEGNQNFRERSPEEVFRERFERLFSEDQARQLAKQVHNPEDSQIAYFRFSNEYFEKNKPQYRSWSIFFDVLYSYLEHRILKNLETQLEERDFRYYAPKDELSISKCKPVLKIFLRERVPGEALRPGLEPGEVEIDEEQIDRDQVLSVESADEVRWLKNIILSCLGEEEREKYDTLLFDVMARDLDRAEDIKRQIEEREII